MEAGAQPLDLCACKYPKASLFSWDFGADVIQLTKLRMLTVFNQVSNECPPGTQLTAENHKDTPTHLLSQPACSIQLSTKASEMS